MAEYPELTKMLNTGECLIKVTEFVKWLRDNDFFVTRRHTDGIMFVIDLSPQDLAAEFFGINLEQAQAELKAMHASFKKAAEYLNGDGNPVESP